MELKSLQGCSTKDLTTDASSSKVAGDSSEQQQHHTPAAAFHSTQPPPLRPQPLPSATAAVTAASSPAAAVARKGTPAATTPKAVVDGFRPASPLKLEPQGIHVNQLRQSATEEQHPNGKCEGASALAVKQQQQHPDAQPPPLQQQQQEKPDAQIQQQQQSQPQQQQQQSQPQQQPQQLQPQQQQQQSQQQQPGQPTVHLKNTPQTKKQHQHMYKQQQQQQQQQLNQELAALGPVLEGPKPNPAPLAAAAKQQQGFEGGLGSGAPSRRGALAAALAQCLTGAAEPKRGQAGLEGSFAMGQQMKQGGQEQQQQRQIKREQVGQEQQQQGEQQPQQKLEGELHENHQARRHRAATDLLLKHIQRLKQQQQPEQGQQQQQHQQQHQQHQQQQQHQKVSASMRPPNFAQQPSMASLQYGLGAGGGSGPSPGGTSDGPLPSYEELVENERLRMQGSPLAVHLGLVERSRLRGLLEGWGKAAVIKNQARAAYINKEVRKGANRGEGGQW